MDSCSQQTRTPVMDLLFSSLHSSTLLIFARYRLFDHIGSRGEAGVSPEELATLMGWSKRAASAMMVSLASTGVLRLPVHAGIQDHTTVRYTLTPRAKRFLLTEAPGCLNAYTQLFWDTSPRWLLGKVSASLGEDGNPNFMLQTGGGAPSKLFLEAMQAQTGHAAMVLAPLLDLRDAGTLVDVGGGSGIFCIQACRSNPSLTGVIYDLAGTCPITEAFIAQAGMVQRIKTHAGDMFKDDSFPPADCYSFGNVLHDWPDSVNFELMKKALASLPEQGEVLLLEMLVAEDVTSTPGACAGMNLLMVTNEKGRQYKASELERMLLEIGFASVTIKSSPLTPYSIVVARKAPTTKVASLNPASPSEASTTDSQEDADDIAPVFDLLFSACHSATLVVCAKSGVFEFIRSKGAAGACPGELAAHLNWSRRASSAIMVSLASNGLLRLLRTWENEQDHTAVKYELTEGASLFLVPGAAGFLNPYMELFWDLSPQLLLDKATASMEERDNPSFMLQTGDGAPSKMFLDAMQAQTGYAAKVLSPLLDLSDVSLLVDVGGGSGTFCIEACKANPHMMGVVYDLASACPLTKEFIELAAATERVDTCAGNMFTDARFPDAQCYSFGNVVHDWSDAVNVELLTKAFASLPTKGKVLLVEMLVAEDVVSTTQSCAGMNLLMVVNEQGRQYKGSELQAMLLNIGFSFAEVVSSKLTPYSVVVAHKR